jgi:hypothetical protein
MVDDSKGIYARIQFPTFGQLSSRDIYNGVRYYERREVLYTLHFIVSERLCDWRGVV